jgi:hypothetical protein
VASTRRATGLGVGATLSWARCRFSSVYGPSSCARPRRDGNAFSFPGAERTGGSSLRSDCPSAVDVAQRPIPHISTASLKAHQPFRAACGNAPTSTFGNCTARERITPPVAIDLYDSMLRSIDQPASCTDFAIPVSSPASSGSHLHRAEKPQIVISAENGQFTAFEFRTPLEIGEPCRLLASNGEADHSRILVPADVIRFRAGRRLQGHVKSKASREPARQPSRYRDGVLWSPAYFAASAGGAPIIK